ncbi:HK97 gp10 family phage protein [Anoxybacillus flavithermus]|nr:HK97 gp10 family phage protein [Anoxybacillus flavithermus]
MANIPIDRLADELTQAIREYTEDVEMGVRKAVEKTAREVLKEAQALAPKRTGEYAKTFVITKDDSYGVARRIIWNKKHYRRVHLLEFGHVKANGEGRVKERPHLRPAYDKYGAALPDELKRIIENGG